MSAVASKRDNAIGELEKILLANPDDMRAARNLVAILDSYMPDTPGLGAYTECQRMLLKKYQEKNWVDDILRSGKIAEHYKECQDILDLMRITSKLPVAQLFAGRLNAIHGRNTYCNLLLSLFEKQGVIPRICNDCYKVQILPLDLIGFMQIYFVLLKLELPRENARKCMIELREDIPYPYKGYIYCESEDEAKGCLEALQQALKVLQISNVYCGISHGCSEYGLKYPEFKYSNDGAHRGFERPEFWDQVESEFWSVTQEPVPARNDYNNQGMSIRDLIGLRTWIDYAEIIGDDSWKMFRDMPSANNPGRFAERVSKQSQLRKTQMDELRQRLASTA